MLRKINVPELVQQRSAPCFRVDFTPERLSQKDSRFLRHASVFRCCKGAELLINIVRKLAHQRLGHVTLLEHNMHAD